MNTEEKITKLENQVKELMSWKENRIRQQITYPLDKPSKDALDKYYLPIRDSFILINPGVTGDFVRSVVKTSASGKDVYLFYDYWLRQCYVDASTDTIYSDNHGYSNGQIAFFYSTDTIPTGLDTIATLYVISAATNSFKVSLTAGGASINITDAGVGNLFVTSLT